MIDALPPKPEEEVIFRADAYAAIGSGHVMRCLALAQGWQDRGGTARFFCSRIPDQLADALRSQRFPVTVISSELGDFSEICLLAESARQTKWIVVDGDGFSSEYLRRLHDSHGRVLLIDDYGARTNPSARVILNQNLNATSSLYEPRSPETELLLGTEYLLLRREFRQRARRTKCAPIARNILVTSGGTDPDNLSFRVATACANLGTDRFHVTIATTSSNLHIRQLKELCEVATPNPTTLLIDPPSMAEVMVNSDLAIIAAGGTLWELLYFGCPVLSYSRNPAQSRLLQDLAFSGTVVYMGATSAFDGDDLASRIRNLAPDLQQRQSMSDSGAHIVDGGGVDRVIERLLQA